MKFLEKDLEEIIYKSSDEQLKERGLFVSGKRFRQLNIGNYGIADMVTVQRPFYHTHFERHMKGLITVYELKKDSVSVSAFFQAVRYMKGIINWLDKHKDYFVGMFDLKIVLVGSDCNSDVVYLGDIFTHYLEDSELESHPICIIDIITYTYEIDGIHFKDMSGHSLINEGF